MGQESNRTLARELALRRKLAPSTAAGLSRLARRDLGGTHSGDDGPDAGRDEAAEEGQARSAQPPAGWAAEPVAARAAAEQPVAARAAAEQPVAEARTGQGDLAARGEHKPATPGQGPASRHDRTATHPKGPGQPSWAVVIATTLRLWAQRHLRRHQTPGTRQTPRSRHKPRGGERPWPPGIVAGLIVLAIAVLAAVLVVALQRHATTTPGQTQASGSQGTGDASAAIARTRRQAAEWIVQQVSPSAIIACDPVMCPALEAQGFASQNLIMLQPSASDPLGSDIVVATAAVRDQFGARLASVFAPDVIASFGSGAARIDVRPVAADGSAAYRTALRSDLHARQDAGSQLLLNRGLAVAPAAARDLTRGQVDSRLLITLAALAARQPMRVVAFGGGGPGASPGLPLCSVDIAGAGAGGAGELQPALEFVRAQLPPYQPLRARIVQLGGQEELHIAFGAPSPLGLLSAGLAP